MGSYRDITTNDIVGIADGTPFVWDLEEEPKMPNKKQMAKNVLNSAKTGIKSALTGKKLKADAETIKRRKAICDKCKYYIDKRCSQCGCFLKYKAALETESCPAGKW